MRHAALFALMTSLAAPSLALAQAEPVALPTLSPRMASHVSRLERVARRTLTCTLYEDAREGPSYDDPRCWGWHERLEGAGPAGVHAVGRVLLTSLASTAEEPSVSEAQRRLVWLLGTSERVQAAPYLVAVLEVSQADSTRSPGLAVAATSGLERVTANDAAPLAPWQNPFEELEAPEARATALAGWRQWYAAHAGERRRQWRRDGLEAARAHLDDAEPRLRYAAIRRLAQSGQAHFALGASLRAVLAQPDLSAPVRRSFARYATRHGLLRQSEVRDIVREASRAARS